MVTAIEIMTGVNTVLVEIAPEYKVYPQRCPKDFKRPSFLIEYVRTSRRDMNKSTVEKTVYLKITCFVEKDAYYRSDTDELAEIQEKIMQAFTERHLTVNDRAIKMQSSTGGFEEDMAFIDLQCTYFDNRTDAVDTTPLVASVNTNLEEV